MSIPPSIDDPAEDSGNVKKKAKLLQLVLDQAFVEESKDNPGTLRTMLASTEKLQVHDLLVRPFPAVRIALTPITDSHQPPRQRPRTNHALPLPHHFIRTTRQTVPQPTSPRESRKTNQGRPPHRNIHHASRRRSHRSRAAEDGGCRACADNAEGQVGVASAFGDGPFESWKGP